MKYAVYSFVLLFAWAVFCVGCESPEREPWNTDTVGDLNSDNGQDTDSEYDSLSDTATETGGMTDTETSFKNDTETLLPTDTGVDTETLLPTDTGVDTETVLPTDTGVDTETVPPTDTGVDTETVLPTDTGVDTETVLPTDTGVDTETVPPTDTGVDTDTLTGSDNGSWELDNGTLHVKFDPNAGGSIGYISESGKSYNVVNIHDKGRYIQQSYYAGQDLNRIASGQHPVYSPWPWNPIQAGDIYGNKSIVLERFNNGTTIYIKTRPMLWDMNGKYAECEFETWATLNGTAIKVKNRLTTHRTDNLWTQVIPKHQELPAVYTIGDLSNLYTYKGDKPWTNGALSKIENSGPPWAYWETSENWAALVNKGNWGLGVYNRSCTLFVGGFSGAPGGGPMGVSTGYISPLVTEALDKTSIFEYEYDLILGNLSTIRSYVYGVH